ncbi:MAG: ABC transporter ATP-binding protein [Proteobacteria bacterium]|nr:ABC transporter ATP-binding protein [Desulfobacula sp.]MBU3953327.1 ABC transporter ATP-binding protein [Pseudomonadota bacterium]MBU4133141.1 ABC transporter ATP-binding protein [Pseudomonadota bacterium]
MQTDLSVVRVMKKFQDFTAVDCVSFDVEKGKFFSILGPSGCGKTTLLRMISGFFEPTSGTIEINGRNMAGIPPNKRPVNLIFQNLALFPMMNVGQNIAFGLERQGEKRHVIQTKTAQMLERVGLPGFEKKKVDQLSGGQRQRVAIARSLILEPAVLLLDEPLGALDLKLREQMKIELKILQTQVGTTFVYITHDQSEALVMSDHVAVMNKGRFEQVDTPRNLYSKPSTPFVARFVGENNQWDARVISLEEHQGRQVAAIMTPEGNQFEALVQGQLTPGDEIDLFLRPEAIVLEPDAAIEGLNRFFIIVRSILFDGANSRILALLPESDREIQISLPQTRQFDHIAPGDRVEAGWSPESGMMFVKEKNMYKDAGTVTP